MSSPPHPVKFISMIMPKNDINNLLINNMFIKNAYSLPMSVSAFSHCKMLKNGLIIPFKTTNFVSNKIYASYDTVSKFAPETFVLGITLGTHSFFHRHSIGL